MKNPLEELRRKNLSGLEQRRAILNNREMRNYYHALYGEKALVDFDQWNRLFMLINNYMREYSPSEADLTVKLNMIIEMFALNDPAIFDFFGSILGTIGYVEFQEIIARLQYYYDNPTPDRDLMLLGSLYFLFRALQHHSSKTDRNLLALTVNILLYFNPEHFFSTSDLLSLEEYEIMEDEFLETLIFLFGISLDDDRARYKGPTQYSRSRVMDWLVGNSYFYNKVVDYFISKYVEDDDRTLSSAINRSNVVRLLSARFHPRSMRLFVKMLSSEENTTVKRDIVDGLYSLLRDSRREEDYYLNLWTNMLPFLKDLIRDEHSGLVVISLRRLIDAIEALIK